MLSVADIVVLVLVAAAFVAVCVRLRRKGACADCASAGACSGKCSPSAKRRCPAMKGVDIVVRDLKRGIE